MQVPKIFKLLNRIERTEDNIPGGSSVVFPLTTSYSEGLGMSAEGGVIADPENVNYGQCDFPLLKVAGSIAVTGESWRKSSAKGVAAFVSVIADEKDASDLALNKELNGQLYRDGSGLRGITSATPSGSGANTTITMLNTTTNYGVKWITQGMRVDLYNAGGVLLQGNLKVVSVNKNANTFVVDNLTAPVTSAYVYRKAGKGTEIMGLNGFVSDTSGPATIQGVTVSGNDFWTAAVLANGGTPRAISTDLLEQLANASGQQNGGMPDVYMTGFTQHRKYAQLAVQTVITEKQAGTGNKVTLDAAYDELTYGGKPFIKDIDAPEDRVFALQDKDRREGLKIWTIGGRQWIPPILDNGKVIWYKLEGMDMYRADFIYMLQFGGYRRNIQAVLTDLAR